MSNRVIVTGVPNPPPGTGPQQPPPRMEINDLVQDDKLFSIFVQALKRMYDVPNDQPTSYFQLGGIHGLGLPQGIWNGATGKTENWYCAHGRLTFPTWHRPYLALFEQALHQHALDVAAEYEQDKEAWQDAANRLRLPYWDWAANIVPPDQVMSPAPVQFTNSKGEVDSMDPNPLFSYRFNPAPPSSFSGGYPFPTTVRNVTSDGTDDWQGLKEELRNITYNTRDQTWKLLKWVHDWRSFSAYVRGTSAPVSSLELTHNVIHGSIGPEGHMGNPAVAAFDPVFWMHHANVDRVLALWQALNPGVWVSGTLRGAPPTTTNTPLTPFWAGAGPREFWISANTVNFEERFGYTYPEFVGLDMSNTQELQRIIGEKVDELYQLENQPIGRPRPGISLPAPPSGTAARAAPSVMSARTAQTPLSKAAEEEPEPAEESTFDWSVQIQSQLYELGRTYSVLVFLGEVPEDSRQWATAESMVGTHCVFVNPSVEECENCKDRAARGEVTEGFVPLTFYLYNKLGMDISDTDNIESYIKDSISCRVMEGHTPVETEKLTSLRVSVIRTTVTQKPGDIFPTLGEQKPLPELTEGQVGGQCTRDDEEGDE